MPIDPRKVEISLKNPSGAIAMVHDVNFADKNILLTALILDERLPRLPNEKEINKYEMVSTTGNKNPDFIINKIQPGSHVAETLDVFPFDLDAEKGGSAFGKKHRKNKSKKRSRRSRRSKMRKNSRRK